MKKRKFSMLLNIAVLCLCVAAIAIGVYSAKNASLNVTGTIGFTAHDCKVDVDISFKNAMDASSFAPITTIKKMSSKSDLPTGYEQMGKFAIGNIVIDDMSNDIIKPLEIVFSVKNDSDFAISAILNIDDATKATMDGENGADYIINNAYYIEKQETKTISFLVYPKNKSTGFAISNFNLTATFNKTVELIGKVSAKTVTTWVKYTKMYYVPCGSGKTYYLAIDDNKTLNLNNSGDFTAETFKNFSTVDGAVTPVTAEQLATLNTFKETVSMGPPGKDMPFALYVMKTSEESITFSIDNNKIVSVPKPDIDYSEIYTNYDKVGYTIPADTLIIPSKIMDSDGNINTYNDLGSGTNKVTNIENYSYIDFVNPESTSIRWRAFSESTKLKSVGLLELVSLDAGVFEKCTELSVIKLPSSLNAVNYILFDHCTKLKYVDIPDSVKEIQPSAFSGCTSLESIVIPSGVKNLYDTCFKGCSLLTSIFYKGTIEEWNKITKVTDWDSNTGNYTVYCTDGEITKS